MTDLFERSKRLHPSDPHASAHSEIDNLWSLLQFLTRCSSFLGYIVVIVALVAAFLEFAAWAVWSVRPASGNLCSFTATSRLFLSNSKWPIGTQPEPQWKAHSS